MTDDKAALGGVETLNDCRPEVLTFALLMERELRANDHKGGWKQDEPDRLAERVKQEAAELFDEALHAACHSPVPKEIRTKVAEEAADVANMAMMVADVCGCLPALLPAQRGEGDDVERVAEVMDAVEKLADAAFIHGMHYQGNERCVEQRAARVTALAAVTDALSRLAALPQPAQGFVAVPVEPTEEMIDKACHATFGPLPMTPEEIHRTGYRAMLAALARKGEQP